MATEPQPKRLRRSRPSAPGDVGSCYFDTIPDDSLGIVLRYLSRRPHHRNWDACISAHVVNTALDVGGAFARAATLEFHSIGGKDGIPLGNFYDASILRSLVYRLPLHRLVLKLSRREVLPDLLHGCGAELREIVLYARATVVTEPCIQAISTHCMKLSSLAIHGYRVEGTLTPIWRSLGATLTRIHICSGILGVISTPDLVEHCVNLHRVDMRTVKHEVADVLVALGSRIRVLDIGYQSVLNIAPWRKVYRACTNLEAVHLELFSSEEAIDLLSLMRMKLVSFTLLDLHALQYSHVAFDDRLLTVLSACSALKRVEFEVFDLVPEAHLRRLFESVKSVTAISWDMRFSHDNPKDIVDVMASNLRNLESFAISTGEPLKGEDVNALVGLPHLKFVALRRRVFHRPVSKPPEECAVEVVKKFKDCAQLVQLDIEDINIKNRSKLVAEAAMMYGRKNFDMFIGGVQYRTW